MVIGTGGGPTFKVALRRRILTESDGIWSVMIECIHLFFHHALGPQGVTSNKSDFDTE